MESAVITDEQSSAAGDFDIKRKTRTQPALLALNSATRFAIGGAGRVVIEHLPFRVGRESRQTRTHTRTRTSDRRVGAAPSLNDLYLLEATSTAHRISREHFFIQQIGEAFEIVDRGSTCGTLVRSQRTSEETWLMIGGAHRENRAPLFDGDIIVVGGPHSPYQFQFTVSA